MAKITCTTCKGVGKVSSINGESWTQHTSHRSVQETGDTPKDCPTCKAFGQVDEPETKPAKSAKPAPTE